MGLGTKFKGDITEGLKLTLEIEPDSSRLLRYFLTMDLFLLMIRLFGFGFNLEKSRSFLKLTFSPSETRLRLSCLRPNSLRTDGLRMPAVKSKFCFES